MNRKNDRRVRYTRMVIRQALLELMRTRPISKITVTDICDLAEINRGTFYAYYTDPYDLLTGIENELFDEISRSIEESLSAGNIDDLLDGILGSIADNGDLCRTLISEYGDKEYMRRIIYIAHDKSIAEWKAMSGNTGEDTLELLYSFIASGSVGVIQHWLLSDMKQSPHEIAGIINKISYRGMNAFLNR